jgi:hypothetical protein
MQFNGGRPLPPGLTPKGAPFDMIGALINFCNDRGEADEQKMFALTAVLASYLHRYPEKMEATFVILMEGPGGILDAIPHT